MLVGDEGMVVGVSGFQGAGVIVGGSIHGQASWLGPVTLAWSGCLRQALDPVSLITMATSSDPWQKIYPPAAFAPEVQAQWPIIRFALLHWHEHQGRHGLPWITSDPYGIWLSEVMLQQTQVSTGLVRYPAWLAQFPTIETLAKASSDQVLAAWSGLGYYARARNLHAAVKKVWAEHAGEMPRARTDRLSLPGIGPSTASAIGAFAFGYREAIFDGNVRRVWARVLADRLPAPLTAAGLDRWLWSYAQAVLPTDVSEIKAWTQAIMDLGATVCTPKAPRCDQCPLVAQCEAFRIGQVTAFPPPKARPVVQRWDLPWAWVRDGDRVAAVERPAAGIWGGLWALPELTATPENPPAAAGRQMLSHRRVFWTLHPAGASVLEGQVFHWLTRSEWEAKPWPRGLREWWENLPSKDQDAWWEFQS